MDVVITLTARQTRDLLDVITRALTEPLGDTLNPGQVAACSTVAVQAAEQFLDALRDEPSPR